MTRLPVLTSARLVKILIKIGFKERHRKGSHIFFEHADGRTTTVPFHKGEDLGRGLLRKILRDIELEPEELRKWL